MPIVIINNIALDSRVNPDTCLTPIPDVDLKIHPSLPKNWLELLATLVSVTQRDLNTHNSHSTAISDGLKLIHQLLTEKNKSGEAVLNDSEKTLIIGKIQEGIGYCHPGFHNRVYSIIQDLAIPKNLDGLLYQIRKNLIQSIASKRSNDTHAQNAVFTVAYRLGYGVRPINTGDTYQEITESLNLSISNTFAQNYHPLAILQSLTEQIKAMLIMEYGYQERKGMPDKGCGLLKLNLDSLPTFADIEPKLEGRDTIILLQDKLWYANYREKKLILVGKRGCGRETEKKLKEIFNDLPWHSYYLPQDADEHDLIQEATNRIPDYAYSQGDVDALTPFFQALFHEDSYAYFNLDDETMTRYMGLNWLSIYQKVLSMLTEQKYFNLSKDELSILHFLCSPANDEEQLPNLKYLFGKDGLVPNSQRFFHLLQFLEQAPESKKMLFINASLQYLPSDKAKLTALLAIFQELSIKQAALVKKVVITHADFIKRHASVILKDGAKELKNALKQKNKLKLSSCLFWAQVLEDTPQDNSLLSPREHFFLKSPELKACLSASSGYSESFLITILGAINIAFTPEKAIKILVHLGVLRSENSFLMQAWLEQFKQLPQGNQIELLNDPAQEPSILSLLLKNASLTQVSPLLSIIEGFPNADKQTLKQTLQTYLESKTIEPKSALHSALQQGDVEFLITFLAYVKALDNADITKTLLLEQVHLFFRKVTDIDQKQRKELNPFILELVKQMPQSIIDGSISKTPEIGTALLEQAIIAGQPHLILKLHQAGVLIQTPQLRQAILLGDINLVKHMLDCGAQIDVQQMLYEAIEAGHGDIVQLFMDRGADIAQRVQNAEGLAQNAFDRALSKDKPVVLKTLAVNIASLPLVKQRSLLEHVAGDYQNVLHYASQQAGHDLVFHLVKNTDLAHLKKILSKKDASRLMRIAAKAGRADIMQQLALRRADINAPNSVGQTPLLLAVEAQCLNTTATLLELGADVGMRINENRNALELCHDHTKEQARALQKVLLLKAVDLTLAQQAELFSRMKPITFPSVLHYALYHLKDKELLCDLMEKASEGVLRSTISDDTQFFNQDNTTLFQEVVSIPGQANLVNKLLPLVKLPVSNRKGETVFESALQAQDTATLEVLLTCNRFCIDAHSIEKAAQLATPALLESLLLAGITYPLGKQQVFYDANYRGPAYLLSLLLKTKKISSATLTKFLSKASENDALLNELCEAFRQNNGGHNEANLLQIIIKARQHVLIPKFVAAGDLLVSKNKQQNTALILAAKIGDLPCVQALLDAPSGLDTLDLVGEDGCSALYWAIRHKHIAVIEYLLNKGARIDIQIQSDAPHKCWCPQGSMALGISLATPSILETIVIKIIQEPFETQQALLTAAFKNQFKHVLDFVMSGMKNALLLEKLILRCDPNALKMIIAADPVIARVLLITMLKDGDRAALPELMKKLKDADLPMGCDTENQTALMFAVVHGTTEAFDEILTVSDAHLNQQDNYGYTALMHAAVHNNISMVTALLEKKADITFRSKKNQKNVIDLVLTAAPDLHLLQPILQHAHTYLSEVQQKELLLHVSGGIYPNVATYVAVEQSQWLPMLLTRDPNADTFEVIRRAKFDDILTTILTDLRHQKKEAPYQTEAHVAATQLLIGLAQEKVLFLSSPEPLTQERQAKFSSGCVGKISEATPDLENIPIWKENLKTGLLVCSWLIIPLIVFGALAYAGFFSKAPQSTKEGLSSLRNSLGGNKNIGYFF